MKDKKVGDWVWVAILLVSAVLLIANMYKAIDKENKIAEKIYYDRGFEKPVIYIYPNEDNTEVNVKVKPIKGELGVTYPLYNESTGWGVIADTDGTLVNKVDGTKHKYLFWEGTGDTNWDMTKGWVVHKDNLESFLKETLTKQSLSEQELNEFIVYWLPILSRSNYNLITFQNEEYNSTVELNVEPQPETLIRVYMVYKPIEDEQINKYANIETPEIQGKVRHGYTVVEWGGSEYIE